MDLDGLDLRESALRLFEPRLLDFGVFIEAGDQALCKAGSPEDATAASKQKVT